jgi:hypothetical protein
MLVCVIEEKGIPGFDVMITIFCDFCQFSDENWRFFLKNQCYDHAFLKN